VKQRLNFSPRPFRERDPRIVFFWLLNLVLLVCLLGTAWYWNQTRTDNRAAHQRLEALRREQRQLAESHRDTVETLEQINLQQYRKDLGLFHGIQIAFGTHWGTLLDDLSAVMNEDVRLTSLRPSRGRNREAGDATLLYLVGQARTKDAQLDLIRTLQKHALFGDVRFVEERYLEGDLSLEFEISFTYRGGS